MPITVYHMNAFAKSFHSILAEHFPSRTLIDEEEEREAQQYAHLYTTPPESEVS